MGEAEVGTSGTEEEDPCFVYLEVESSDLSTNTCHGDTVLGWQEKQRTVYLVSRDAIFTLGWGR